MKALASDMLHAALDAMPVARLALRDADGNPEALPIVFARVGDCLYSPIDGKPKRTGVRLGRLARIEQSPDVMLVLDHYADDWSELWWIRLRGTSEIVGEKHPEWQAAEAALAAKYPQYDTTPMFVDEPTMIRLPWRGVSWWAAAGLDGLSRWLDEWAPAPARENVR